MNDREISLSLGTFILALILVLNSCSTAKHTKRIADALERAYPKDIAL